VSKIDTKKHKKMDKIAEIKKKLKEDRYSLSLWAKENGFKPSTVRESLRRAVNRKPGRGSIAAKIVARLQKKTSVII
jgi:gp16 family phage-associated protein